MVCLPSSKKYFFFLPCNRALKPPGYRRDWHVGVRRKNDGKLVAFITAIPANISVRGK